MSNQFPHNMKKTWISLNVAKLFTWRTLAVNGYWLHVHKLIIKLKIKWCTLHMKSWNHFWLMSIILNHKIKYTRQMPSLIQVFCVKPVSTYIWRRKKIMEKKTWNVISADSFRIWFLYVHTAIKIVFYLIQNTITLKIQDFHGIR